MLGSVCLEACLFICISPKQFFSGVEWERFLDRSQQAKKSATQISISNFSLAEQKWLKNSPSESRTHTQIAEGMREERDRREPAHIYVLLVCVRECVCGAHSKRLLTLRATEHMSVISAFELTP